MSVIIVPIHAFKHNYIPYTGIYIRKVKVLSKICRQITCGASRVDFYRLNSNFSVRTDLGLTALGWGLTNLAGPANCSNRDEGDNWNRKMSAEHQKQTDGSDHHTLAEAGHGFVADVVSDNDHYGRNDVERTDLDSNDYPKNDDLGNRWSRSCREMIGDVGQSWNYFWDFFVPCVSTCLGSTKFQDPRLLRHLVDHKVSSGSDPLSHPLFLAPS